LRGRPQARDVRLNPRITVLELGTGGISDLAPAQRRGVVAHRRGSVLLSGLLVPLSAVRSRLPL
jgi:hypothetical protein